MRNFIKKAVALALSCTAALGLAGCGETPDAETGAVDESGNTVVKVMFHVDESSAEGKAYKQRVSAFNTDYKSENIKISATFKARDDNSMTGYDTELSSMLNAGNLPDIITFDAPNCASYAATGLLYDLSSLVPQDVQDDFISLNEYDGKLYGLPIQESSAGFFYNKALLDQAGVNVSGYTVENPWTFDQFKEVCQKLKNAGIQAVDMRLRENTGEQSTYLLYPFIYAAGGQFVSQDGFTATGYFNGTGAESGFRFIKDLVDAQYTSFTVGADSNSDFMNGKVGLYLSSGWTIPDIREKYESNFPSGWGILPYPKGTVAASATGSWSFGITDNQHTDKSKIIKALLYLVTPESSKAITNATGMIPALKSVETNYAAGSPESVLRNQLQTTGKERPVTVGYPKFSTCFRNVLTAINGGKSVAEALNTEATSLQQELNKLKGV